MTIKQEKSQTLVVKEEKRNFKPDNVFEEIKPIKDDKDD